MKYKIKPTATNNFTPFTLTLSFETKEEWLDFHDNIMSKITKTSSHQFHADFYEAQDKNSKGEI